MKPVPNRLVVTPKELYEQLEKVLENEYGYDQRTQAKRIRKCINIVYSTGYQDGYRDGHTDAENGHDERVRAALA